MQTVAGQVFVPGEALLTGPQLDCTRRERERVILESRRGRAAIKTKIKINKIKIPGRDGGAVTGSAWRSESAGVLKHKNQQNMAEACVLAPLHLLPARSRCQCTVTDQVRLPGPAAAPARARLAEGAPASEPAGGSAAAAAAAAALSAEAAAAAGDSGRARLARKAGSSVSCTTPRAGPAKHAISKHATDGTDGPHSHRGPACRHPHAPPESESGRTRMVPGPDRGVPGPAPARRVSRTARRRRPHTFLVRHGLHPTWPDSSGGPGPWPLTGVLR
jgi:hypothetical protein